MRNGDSAILKLEASLGQADPSSSSHWNLYHQHFQSTNGGRNLQGLEGFGSPALRSTWRNLAHRLFLAPYGRTYIGDSEFKQNKYTLDLIARRSNRCIDLDMYRQLLAYTWINKQFRTPPQLNTTPPQLRTWCIIGDGFGVFTSLVLLASRNARVVLVNLDRTLIVDLVYIKKILGNAFEKECVMVESQVDIDELAYSLDSPTKALDTRLIAVRARDANLLSRLPIDLVVNIDSMQEMEYPEIKKYFQFMRTISKNRDLFFYCCNRDDKLLPDGTRIEFDRYGWKADDEILIDEPCPWHRFWYTLRPPRYRRYDGPVRHRLVKMAPDVC